MVVPASRPAGARLGLAHSILAAVLAARLDVYSLVEEGVAALLALLVRLAVVHMAHGRAVDDVVLVVHALVHLQQQSDFTELSSIGECTDAHDTLLRN